MKLGKRERGKRGFEMDPDEKEKNSIQRLERSSKGS